MTDARLAYLDEQRWRLYVQQRGRCAPQRWRLYVQQRGRCAHCGRVYQRREIYMMALAHRVANSKVNRAKYGAAALDHDLCKGLVCRELHGGQDCNAALLLDGKPGTAAALMREIRERLGVEA